MLYKLFLIALFLAVSININHAQVDDESETTLTPGGGGGDDNGNDTDTGTDIDVDTDVNGDDNGETDDDNNDDDDDAFLLFETTDMDMETTDDSIDDTDDSMETTGGTQDDSGSNDDDSDDESDDSVDVDSEEEDLCIGLTLNDCSEVVEDDGDAECAYNAVTGDCYSIERRDGRMGSGNFDDGYNAAIKQADDDQAQLELLVAVLGVLVGILVLVIIGGAFYLYKKGDGKANHQHLDQSMHAEDDGGADRLITA